jgi:hypothetical protein
MGTSSSSAPTSPLQQSKNRNYDILPLQVAMDKGKRDKKIIADVQKYGYTQQQIAAHLDMHYSTISNSVRGKA